MTFLRFSKKVYDPQTKNPILGEHLSYPFDLQRRKLKPERGWDLLRKVQSVGEDLRAQGERGRILTQALGPRRSPPSALAHRALHLRLGQKQGTSHSRGRGMNQMTPGRIRGRLASVPSSGGAAWRVPGARMLGSHWSLQSLRGRPACTPGRGGPGLIGTGNEVISEVTAVTTLPLGSSLPVLVPPTPGQACAWTRASPEPCLLTPHLDLPPLGLKPGFHSE